MNLPIKSLWKRAAKVEKAFVIALVLYLILRVVWRDSGLETFAALVAYALGVWVALRLLRGGLRKLTWRLRNRLIVAYLFIAVLPILLVLTLVGLGAYILAGQVAVYLVRSELDRRVAALRSVDQDLSAAPATIRHIGETDQQRFPGLILFAIQNGATQKWPPDADVTLPAKLPANSSGYALRGGRYYAWADIVSGEKQALVLTPLSRQYLSEMMRDLGDVYFVQREFIGAASDEGPPAATSNPKTVPSAGSTKLGAQEDEQFRLSPAGGDALHTALSPPVNRFDVGVRWGSVMRVVDWEHPESRESALLVGYTRLSSILTTILSQSSDYLANAVLDVFYGVAVAFLLVAIAGLAIGISMSRSITRAVHSLYEGTERVLRGDFSHLIQVTGRDQIAQLSTSFNTMTQNLERLLAVAKEKERMQAEIEIARGVQDQLYPKAPPVFESLRVLGMCDPARMVSGDYYDYQLVDGKLAIAIGDVAGKGISAALLMATIQAAMRMELRASADLSPSLNGMRFSTARMVSELNQQLHATTSPEKYATFFFAIYDQTTGLMTYTNAGHLQPVLFRDGAAKLLDVNGTVVGAFPFSKYEESKIELRSGDLLVCYTDGITEPENEYGEMFGEERLIELVAKNADRDEGQIIETVMESVRQWTGVPELSDDMTVLLARKR
ncbi:MAG TPA: SpoIIE family protein phosphatase [Bryobacteraceae bacterium]|nr:SpoIIE family protein phosphatase [Bryobacteraceae bacterium]